jgi:uncharacterized damage-inducible protein DinB
MRLKACLLAGMLCCCSGMAVAQMGMSEAKVAVGSAMDPAKAQDALLSMFEQELMGVVKAMPADKFDFAPGASLFAQNSTETFSGVRTFGQQAIHLAQANYFFFQSFGGPKPTVDLKGMSQLKSKDQIVAALQGSFAYAHQAIASITAANAYQGIEGVDGMHTRATVASFAVAHGFDHYGQMVEYLRMNGVVPPGSK